MSQINNPQTKKPFPLIPALAVALVGVILLTVGGFAFAASQETHDPFCASCHTQPETTFFQRSAAAQQVDLASFHTAQNTRCIDCHSGQGLPGRLSAELMGAHNALLWYTGGAVQPAVLTTPIGDGNCLKCHQNVTSRGFQPMELMTAPNGANEEGEREGRNNHWHTFLTRWQAQSPDAAACVTCHSGHATDVNQQNGFLNDQNVVDTCDACHRVMHREGE